jgi:hypothetical protein
MQSSQEVIDRFIAAEGAVGPVEWLDERGIPTRAIEDAVEARVGKRLKAGGVLTVRVDLARLPALEIA